MSAPVCVCVCLEGRGAPASQMSNNLQQSKHANTKLIMYLELRASRRLKCGQHRSGVFVCMCVCWRGARPPLRALHNGWIRCSEWSEPSWTGFKTPWTLLFLWWAVRNWRGVAGGADDVAVASPRAHRTQQSQRRSFDVKAGYQTTTVL